MKKYLALYIGTASPEQKATTVIGDDTKYAGMEAWGQWMTQHAADIIDGGSPLGKTKTASAAGLSDTQNRITGYVIVRAESHEAAAKMFEGHPHFSIFPGDSVEIMQCLDVPRA